MKRTITGRAHECDHVWEHGWCRHCEGTASRATKDQKAKLAEITGTDWSLSPLGYCEADELLAAYWVATRRHPCYKAAWCAMARRWGRGGAIVPRDHEIRWDVVVEEPRPTLAEVGEKMLDDFYNELLWQLRYRGGGTWRR